MKISKNTLYTIVVALAVTILLVSNIASTKLFDFFGTGLVWDGGAILFPVSYVLSDVIVEIYGLGRAKKIIWITLAMNIVAVVALFLVQLLPPGGGWNNQAAYEAIIGFMPRLVAGSLLAYATGQILNAYVFEKIKKATKGQRLWQRALGSSVVGDLVDTLIFTTVAFAGVISGQQFVGLIVIAYFSKLLGETILLPATYAATRFMKKVTDGEPI
ncbi:MAG: queuosine precursor transporter [Candidatus Nomurabacteria bacterium]|jgi:uncharacterized integral membrane protein (TIGR00697 family)|nr:queuosine precursor transporter [Candidatus Nomurabacteria bacterium]